MFGCNGRRVHMCELHIARDIPARAVLAVRGPRSTAEMNVRLEWSARRATLPASELACHRPPVINAKRPCWEAHSV